MLKGSAPLSVPETIVDGEVHVWRTRLDATAGTVATLRATLSPDEMGKAERMRFPRDGRRFVVARGILRSLVGAYLEADASDLRFEYGPHGKPFLARPARGCRLSFNLSHTDDVALYAIALDRAVGVDVERVGRGLPDDVIIRMFSERERAALGGLPADARPAAVMAWWTAKEAYVKARGVGLSLDPAGLEVVHADAAPVGVRRIDEGDPRDEPWSFRALDPWPGYVAALVAAGRGLSLSFRECRHGGVP